MKHLLVKQQFFNFFVEGLERMPRLKLRRLFDCDTRSAHVFASLLTLTHLSLGISGMMLRTTRIVKRPSEKLCYQRRFSIVPKSFSAGTFKRSRRLFSGAKLATSELDGVDSSDDFGEYEIILPPDPPVWGVSHLTPRTVPADILRPPYARPGSGTTPISSSAAVSEDPYHGDPYEGDGRIELGGESEKKLRLSASLARRVLEVAEKLVKVMTLPFYASQVDTKRLFLTRNFAGWSHNRLH